MSQGREAMLRPEFHDWYPTVDPGTWYPAEELSVLVRDHRGSGTPQWEPESRIPCDKHFLFRGGSGRRSDAARTRQGDRPGE